MRASCAPYKFCKQKGGTRKQHNKGKKDFKYDPFYRESKFKVRDSVKITRQFNENECMIYMYLVGITEEKCKELHNDRWTVTKVEEGFGIGNEYVYYKK